MFCVHTYVVSDTLLFYIYDGLECHSGSRFEREMYSTRSDRNRKNNCVRIKKTILIRTYVYCNERVDHSVKKNTVNK